MFNGRISEVGVLLGSSAKIPGEGSQNGGKPGYWWLGVREWNLPVRGGDR